MPDDRAGKTAAELVAELAADPARQARRRELDEQRRQAGLELLRQLAPLMERLRADGVDLPDVNALRSARGPVYRLALPAVLTTLEEAPPRVLDVLGGVLARGDAAPTATLPVMRAYLRRRVDDGAQWSLANALSEIADDRIAADLAAAIEDEERGKSREMLVVAAGRLSPALGTPIAVRALEHPALDGHALIALRALGAIEAAPQIRARADRWRGWKRKEAKRTLAALTKADARGRKA